MKAKLNPRLWSNIISSASISGDIDPIHLKVTAQGIIAKNAGIGGHILSIVVVSKGYFVEYEVGTDSETIVFGNEVADRLKWGFTKDEISVETSTDRMIIRDDTDELPVKLSTPRNNAERMPIIQTKYGIIPDIRLYSILKDGTTKPDGWSEERALEGYSVYQTEAKNIMFPSSVVNYYLNTEKDEITVTIFGVSTDFKHKVDGKFVSGNTSEEKTIIIDAEDFQHIIKNLSGDVFLLFDDARLIITESEDNINKAYVMSLKTEAAE